MYTFKYLPLNASDCTTGLISPRASVANANIGSVLNALICIISSTDFIELCREELFSPLESCNFVLGQYGRY